MKKLFIGLLMIISSASFALTSSENREDQKWNTSLGYGWSYSATSINTEGTYYLGPNDSVGLKYSVANIKNDSMRASTIFYRKFIGNSFYISPLIYFRDFETTSLYRDDHYTDIGFGVNIGNQWHWKNIFLGVDWLGGFVSAARLKVRGDAKIDKDFGASSALNLYIGYSF